MLTLKRAHARHRGAHGARNQRLAVAVAALVAIGAQMMVSPGASSALVTAVTGSAFGVSVPDFTIFAMAKPPVAPTPTVTLPMAGSAVPVTATAPSESVNYNPPNLFSSGVVNVSTQGTAAGGSVTSSSTLQTATTGQFASDSTSSTCTASATGITASTTIVNGHLDTATDANGNPTTTVTIPTNPSANDAINGTINNVGDSFTYVFNEQTPNPDGSLTVTAFHVKFLGPNAKGDMFVGQSTCGVTATTTTTTVPPTTTTTVPATTTTTVAATTTTTHPTTTTTVPATTTTTHPTTTTTVPATTTTTVPATTTTVVPPTTTTVVPGNTAMCQALVFIWNSIRNPFYKAFFGQLIVAFGCPIPKA